MIQAGMCNRAKLDFLKGVHQPTDQYRIALYMDRAKLSPETDRYTGDGEVHGPGYTTGGALLSGYKAGLIGEVAFITFNPVDWQNSTITARGALIFNASKGNAAVVVMDFGEVKKSSVGLFRVEFPTPSEEGAVIWFA